LLVQLPWASADRPVDIIALESGPQNTGIIIYPMTWKHCLDLEFLRVNTKVTYYHGTEILKLYLYFINITLYYYASISCTQY